MAYKQFPNWMTEGEGSVFNIAAAYLKRINYLLGMASLYAKHKDYNNWYDTLLLIEVEASIKMSEEEIEAFEKMISPAVENLQRQDRKSRGELFNLLRKCDMHLRKILDKKGMLLPDKQDPGLAIFNQ